VVLLAGGLFAVSADNSGGTDLRPGRYTDLASLVDNESDQVDALKGRATDLNREIEGLTRSLEDRQVKRWQQRIAGLRDPAGLEPRSGPGVTVTLSDAPDDVMDSTSEDVNLLLVHQQDIQAVVNAMWRGGATAVTINGQRVVTTTGIKCEGNSVQLQGQPYPQPYVISAVGDPTSLTASIDGDDYLDLYREQSEEPEVDIGWDLKTEDALTAPAFDGLLDLSYARPLS